MSLNMLGKKERREDLVYKLGCVESGYYFLQSTIVPGLEIITHSTYLDLAMSPPEVF